jgi:fermentation-respiration switch protein FrsA (DUF1100 family)
MPDEKPKRSRLQRGVRLAVRILVFGILLLLGLSFLNTAALYPGVFSDDSVGPQVAAKRHDVREVSFTTDDEVELYGWVQGADTAPRKIIQFMGNGEFVGPSAGMYEKTGEALGAQFLLFDYRGFGNSEGRPSEEGLYSDARAAWRFATTDLGWRPVQTILWGRSMGGAPAVKLTSELIESATPPAALILESPFSSIRDMARATLPYLIRPEWLVCDDYDNVALAPLLTLPVFHFHSTTDEVIPFEQALALHEALPEPKDFLRLEGVGHNETWGDKTRADMIRARIDAFLKRHA